MTAPRGSVDNPHPPTETQSQVGASGENTSAVSHPSTPQQYQIRPMNCPFHCLIYKSKGHGAVRSYREFPIRLAELGTVYRYERSGT